MNATNQHDLPSWLYRLLSYDTYGRGDMPSDISVTQLIDSPMVRRLRIDHKDAIEEEAVDRLWSVYGTAIHDRAQEANSNSADVIMEKRLYHRIGDKVLSGQFDIYEPYSKNLTDIKVTSAWSVTYGGNSKWEPQLNVLAYLLAQHDYEVKSLTIGAILRDWQRSKAGDGNYPALPVQLIDIPLWSQPKQLQYIIDRMRMHFDDAPTCSDEERWRSPDKFAVMKEGRKSALRVLDTKDAAERWQVANTREGDGTYIDYRAGAYKRCEAYCSVADFCAIKVNAN